MADELSPESAERIAKVRQNEMSIDDLSYDELVAMTTHSDSSAQTERQPAPAPPQEQEARNATSDGSHESTTATAEPGQKQGARPQKLDKQYFANEANTLRQRLESLPKKLMNDPVYLETFLEQNPGLREKLTERLTGTQPTFDKTDPYAPQNIEMLMAEVERLKDESARRALQEEQARANDMAFREVDDFLDDTAPELRPSKGSWRKLNEQLSEAFRLAENDPTKLDDPAFRENLAKKGIEIPDDPNFVKLTEIHALKREKGLSMEDAYLIWRGKNPDKAVSVPKKTQEAIESDRAENVLGTNTVSQGNGAGIKPLMERLSDFNRRCGHRMDLLSAREEQEWAALEAEINKKP